MNKTSRLLMLVPAACVLLVLTACGNKGPLVMPQKPVPIEEQEVTPADVPQDATATPPVDTAPQTQDNTEDGGTKPAGSADSNNG